MTRLPSIRQRLQSAILLPVGFALAVISVVFFTLQWRSSSHASEQRVETLAHLIASTSASALAFQDAQDAESVLNALQSEAAVRDAALYTASGTLFATYSYRTASEPTPAKPLTDGIHRERRSLIVFQPVTDGQKRYGTFFVRWDLQPFYEEMRVYAITAGVLLLGTFLIAVGIGGLLRRSIISPILALAQTAKTIADNKDYRLRAPKQSSAELGLLADAFNEMLSETHGSQARLATEIEATKRAQHRVSTILASVSDAFMSFDPQWHYNYVSEKAEELLGFSRERVMGKHIDDVSPELVGTELRGQLQEVMREQRPTHVDFLDARRSRWFEYRIYPSDEGVAVFFTEITERKRAEDALRRWEFIFTHAGWAVAATEPDTDRIILANPAFATMHGYSLDALVGQPMRLILAPGSSENEQPREETSPSDQADRIYEAIHVRRDGTTFPVITHVSVLTDAHGSPLFRAATVQDITPWKNAQDALRASEEQLRLITNATPALISYIDRDFRYRFANRHYEVWFGRPGMQIIGRSVSEVVGEAAFAGLRPQMVRALRGEQVQFEMLAPYSSGGYRWIHANYIPHFSESGAALGLFVLVLDINERKQMETALTAAHGELEKHSQHLEEMVQERTSKLREAVEELEGFSYSIAHDMRAPLRSMQGYSRLLLEEHLETLDEEGRSFLRRIAGSADRLDRLIQDILNYSRVVRADMTIEPVNFVSLVEDLVNTYPNLQRFSSAIHVQPDIPVVLGNMAALTQVASNLIGNAIKFVPNGTEPSVKIYSQRNESAEPTAPDEVTIWFEDNGIGIPKESQRRLFTMFQRLNRPELYEGTGIGLAVARKAMERMGGTIGLESEEGRGSKFWIKLKCAPAT